MEYTSVLAIDWTYTPGFYLVDFSSHAGTEKPVFERAAAKR